MSVKIDAGEIIETNSVGMGRFKRMITISDDNIIFMRHIVFADKKEELEIIDYEDFMKE